MKGMKILFVENREKTKFWEEVALSLRQKGADVIWLIQNHKYRPKKFEDSSVFILPYPRFGKKSKLIDREKWVRQKYPFLLPDRGRTFFNAGAEHYEHYEAEISRIIAEQKPNIVIGESTLFHELLTIHLCRVAGISYVQPISNRYPRGRFTLFAYDVQVPAVESGDRWAESDAQELAERIAASNEIPFYMQSQGRAKQLRRNCALLRALGRVWWGRLRGESYNTPSLKDKFILQSQVRRNLNRWRSLQSLPSNSTKTVLYPMQLQPEANIDVWGRPYSNQVEVIREMLAAAPSDFTVAIKANPKAKYELNEDLFALAEKNPRVCLLPLDVSMPVALSKSIGAVTVTGTVGFEAICGKGRAVSLRHPIIADHFPEFHADSPTKAIERLIKDPSAGLGDVSAGSKLINILVSQSFPGVVGDPVLYPECMNANNVHAVADGLLQLMKGD